MCNKMYNGFRLWLGLGLVRVRVRKRELGLRLVSGIGAEIAGEGANLLQTRL